MKANANVAGIFLLFIFLLRAVGLEAYQYPSVPRTVTKRSHEASFIKFYNDVDLLPTASPFQANALHQRSCARKNIILQSDISGNDVIDLLPTKKDSLQEKYKMASILYRIIATIFFGMPDKTFTTRLASKFGGAAGFGVASGVSYILSKATGKDRLGSETYKRLNVGLLGFSILGLFAIPGEAAFLPKALPAMLLSMGASAARLYVAFVSYLGWSWGVLQNRPEAVVTNKESSRMLLTPKLALTEILQGMKNSIKGMKVIKANKKKSLFYRNAGLLVLFGMFSSFMQGLFNVRYASALSKTAFDSSLQWSAVSRLFLISTLIFSLKDAAERDRLQGTTFIQLNLMIGAWSFLVWIGQGITLTTFSTHRVEMMAFSLPFFIRSLKFQKMKSDGHTSSPLLRPPPEDVTSDVEEHAEDLSDQ